jgi:hypothetical protein
LLNDIQLTRQAEEEMLKAKGMLYALAEIPEKKKYPSINTFLQISVKISNLY